MGLLAKFEFFSPHLPSDVEEALQALGRQRRLIGLHERIGNEIVMDLGKAERSDYEAALYAIELVSGGHAKTRRLLPEAVRGDYDEYVALLEANLSPGKWLARKMLAPLAYYAFVYPEKTRLRNEARTGEASRAALQNEFRKMLREERETHEKHLRLLEENHKRIART